jgi:predicted alpha/beta superfamily hydrolase
MEDQALETQEVINPENLIEKSKVIEGMIVRHNFFSESLQNERPVDIYLPPGYETETEQYYPVIYMHDGNNLFDPNIAFGDVHWEVDTTIEKLLKINQIEKLIVVGIHNTMGRNYEYTWVPMELHGKEEGGGGSKYAEFIIKELKPFIDSNYRTLKDRENTAVIGSSLGGLISLYLGKYYPDTFSKIGAMSASLWWAGGAVIEDLKDIRKDLKIWLDMGTGERMANDLFIRLKELLVNKGYVEAETVVFLEDLDAGHNEHDWAKRFYLPLLFFFSKNGSA